MVARKPIAPISGAEFLEKMRALMPDAFADLDAPLPGDEPTVRDVVQSVVDEALAVVAAEHVAMKLLVDQIPGTKMLRGGNAIVVVGHWRGEEHRLCAGTSDDTRPAHDIRYALRRWLGRWMQEARGRGESEKAKVYESAGNGNPSSP